jgi:hypothetical protein
VPQIAFLVADQRQRLAKDPAADVVAPLGKSVDEGDGLLPASPISVRCITTAVALSGAIWGAVGLLVWLVFLV